jgi:hypothetical protein
LDCRAIYEEGEEEEEEEPIFIQVRVPMNAGINLCEPRKVE